MKHQVYRDIGRAGGIAGAVFAALALAAPAAAQPDGVRSPKACSNCVVLLGTKGGPVVDPARSESASLLVVDGEPYEIDAGAGAARQIVAAGYPLTAVRTIFITHHHLDHTAGLEPIISLGWIGAGLRGGAITPLNVYGPPSTAFLVDAALNYLSVSERIFRAGIPSLPQSKTIVFGHDVAPGPVYQDARIKVTAVANTHFGSPSTGPSGARDQSFSYRFDTAKGAVVFTGDTGPSEAVTELAKGADILVSEVYLPRADIAERRGSAVGRELGNHMTREHLSPADVGKMAQQAGVKRVVLNHIAAPDAPDSEQRLIDGVHEFYKGPVAVGHDLMAIDLGTGR